MHRRNYDIQRLLDQRAYDAILWESQHPGEELPPALGGTPRPTERPRSLVARTVARVSRILHTG